MHGYNTSRPDILPPYSSTSICWPPRPALLSAPSSSLSHRHRMISLASARQHVNALRQRLPARKYIVAGLACVIVVASTGHALYNLHELQDKNPTSSVLDILLYANIRAMLGVVWAPFGATVAALDQTAVGVGALWRISGEEWEIVMRMYLKILSGRLIRLVIDAVKWVLNQVGWMLRPVAHLMFKGLYVILPFIAVYACALWAQWVYTQVTSNLTEIRLRHDAGDEQEEGEGGEGCKED